MGEVVNAQQLGTRLKLERTRLGFTLPEVGKIAGAVKTTVIDWENGVSSPKATQLATLCDVGFDPLFVLTGVRAMRYPGRSDEDDRIAAEVLDLAFALPADDRDMWLLQGQAFLNRAIELGRTAIKRRLQGELPAFLRSAGAVVSEPSAAYKEKKEA